MLAFAAWANLHDCRHRLFLQVQVQTSIHHNPYVTSFTIFYLSAPALLQDLMVLQGFDVYKLDTGDLSYSELNKIAGFEQSADELSS